MLFRSSTRTLFGLFGFMLGTFSLPFLTSSFGVGSSPLAFAHAAYVPVYVMLPLDTVTNQNTLKNPEQLRQWFSQLRSANVDGIMTDVWWGLVERNERQYDWSAYRDLFSIARDTGLKVQVVMSFHECGGNVGDACSIPLPPWIQQIGNSNPDIYYTDQNGHRDLEYLSLGIDRQLVLNGRSAIGVYSDFFRSFSSNFTDLLGSTITEIQVGLGPAGEMRYPSYQLTNNLWSFCGIGAFQCYDKYMLADLAQSASQAGHPEWGHGGPSNAGSYKSMMNDAPFFTNGNDNYASDYGRFFLTWYSNKLIQHGDDILAAARGVFGNRVELAAKIAGIHWWYLSASHPAELTAGYYNTNNHDGYAPIAAMFKKYGVTFDFTCLEMRDSEQPSSCQCGPAELVVQTENDAFNAGIKYAGENALPRYDSTAYQQIEHQSYRSGSQPISSFTYLRLTPDLLSGSNWSNFCSFVNTMHNLGPSSYARAQNFLRGSRKQA